MSEYPKVLDDAESVAAQAIAKVAEIQQALNEASSHIEQFAGQMDLGAKAIRNSTQQVEQDLASHSNAEGSFQAALAAHTDAGFGENNEAAGRVTSNLTGCLQEMAQEQSALVGMQHALALGSASDFALRKHSIRSTDLVTALGRMADLQERQERVVQRLQAYKEARIREYRATKEAEDKIGQTQEAIVQTLLQGSDQPQHTSQFIADGLETVSAELSEMPEDASKINQTMQRIIGEIDEARDALHEWHAVGIPPEQVVSAQNELDRLKAELVSQLNPAQLEADLENIIQSKRAFEVGERTKKKAGEALSEASQNLAETVMAIARYLITRGG